MSCGSLASLLTALISLLARAGSGTVDAKAERITSDDREDAAPPSPDGKWLFYFRILFCFDNGMVTGNGAGVVWSDRGEIKKGYRFGDGHYRFGG